jgi:VWFA-related protein
MKIVTCFFGIACLMQAQVIRTTTNVVDVTVVASTNNLTAADIQIFDNGKEQNIATFQKVIPQPPAAKGVFSNRGPDSSSNRVLSVILLDALNTAWSDQAFARNQVVRILKSLRPDEEVAIFVLSNKIRVLHDFSSDRESLTRKAEGFKGDNPSLSVDDPDTASASYSEVFSNTAVDPRLAAEIQARKADTTLAALGAIGNGLKRLPGRKNLIWVSAGFPVQVNAPGATMMPAMDRRVTFDASAKGAVSALLAANIAVYPVDARGLSVDPRARTNVAIMQDLARQTGGVAYYSRNDVATAVREALDDTREAYVVTYSPQQFEEDGKFHKIQIKTKLKDVHLRHRNGYYAPNPGTDQVAENKQRFTDALASPIGIGQIGLSGELLPSQAPDRLSILVRIEGEDLGLVANEDRWQGEITLAGVQVGPSGEVLMSASQTTKFNMGLASYQKALLEGVKVEVDFQRIAKAKTFRMAIMNTQKGNIGSLSFPLKTP